MMRWEIRNTTVLVHGAADGEARWLCDYLSYVERRYVPGARRYEDKHRSLFNAFAREFPAGFARVMYREALSAGLEVEVVDARVPPCPPDDSVDLSWLAVHPVAGVITHQIAAVEACVRWKRGIIWAPTASGKTEIAIGLAQRVPCRWLFMVHRSSLLQQTADRYMKRTGLPAGIIGDGKVDVPDGCRFVVAMFQTMHAAAKNDRREILTYLLGAEGVICDECHAIGADTLYDAAMRATNAYYRIGMSATPLSRGDQRNMLTIGCLGQVIYRIRPEELIEKGLLAVPRIRMVPVRQQSAMTEWRDVYDECVVESRLRNGAVVDIVRRCAKPALVFVQEVEHGKALTRLIEQAGMRAEFVYGAKDTRQRRAAVERLVRTDIDALVTNCIFQEGVDIPSLRSIVVASAGKSTIAAVQRVGRGMRVDAATGKDECEVWDVADLGCGCTNDDRQYAHFGCRLLERHMAARKKAYEAEGYKVEIKSLYSPGDLV
jgi:hypothetical protein